MVLEQVARNGQHHQAGEPLVRPDRPFELDEFGTVVELRFP